MIRVLIVDDETIACALIRGIIENHFPQISMIGEAHNGKVAVEKAREMEPDMVIMDIEMPIVNGIEASRQIRKLFPGCAIIFLTAFASFPYAKEAITLGAEEYLLKPIEENALVAVIRQTLMRLRKDTREEGGRFLNQGEKEPAAAGESGSRSLMVVHQVKNYIDLHYMEDISVESLADQFRISASHFNRIFKQNFQVNCKEYITGVRMDKARKYLAGPALTVSEVGSMVGYPDANYFAKVFRKRFGMTPKEYRNEQFFLPDD